MRYLPLTVAAGLALALSAASAQERPGTTQAKPSPGSTWVKLCETPASAGRDLFGKPAEIGVKTCLIHHERLDSTSGNLHVAAGIRQTGARHTFTVMLPADVHQPSGTRVDIFPLDLWEKVLRREPLKRPEIPRMRTLKLKFAVCRADGCTAETDADPGLMADLRSSAGFVVFAFRYGQKPTAYPVTLGGFGAAYDGPATDSTRFYAARAELLRRFRERQGPRIQPQRPKGQDI